MGAAFPEPGAGSPRCEENGPGQQLTDLEVQVTPAKLLAMLFGVAAGCILLCADVSRTDSALLHKDKQKSEKAYKP